MRDHSARMALPSTLHHFDVELAHVDRGIERSLSLKVARHPSETEEYLVTRVLAYCLEFTEGIALTEGVAAGNEPAAGCACATAARSPA